MIDRHGMIGVIGTSASALDVIGSVTTVIAGILTVIYMTIFIYRELKGRRGKHD